MITTTYPPETGWIAVRHAELVAVAEGHRRTPVGRNPETRIRRRPRTVDRLQILTPNLNRTEHAR